jgi:hypothetical protein
MLSRPRILPAGFIAPCLPTKTERPPSGEFWLHEIKHDGFRVIARKDGAKVRAAADMVRFWQYVQPEVMTACIPVQADAKQIVDVVMKYIRESPQDRHNAGAVIVAMAAMNAWPCKAQGKPS